MHQPVLLDLFCGAGGAAKGYADAGFTVIGVDKERQPRYPYPFIQDDALNFLDWVLAGNSNESFDVIHASPPCQRYSYGTPANRRDGHPDLIGPVRDALEKMGLPYVIENVEGSPLINPVRLCGSAFGLYAYDTDGTPLYLRRHRLFEASGFEIPSVRCHHPRYIKCAGAYGGGGWLGDRYDKRGVKRGYVPAESVLRELFRIDWMTGREIREAIPPAYTEFIGKQLIGALEEKKAA